MLVRTTEQVLDGVRFQLQREREAEKEKSKDMLIFTVDRIEQVMEQSAFQGNMLADLYKSRRMKTAHCFSMKWI